MLPHKGNEKPASNNFQNLNLSTQIIDSFHETTNCIKSQKFLTKFLVGNLLKITFA